MINSSILSPSLSVIVCTHNPREQYLKRVLSALEAQTLPVSEWELIVVDNASSSPLADRFDISWHPAGRHVREDELGLSSARIRGIKEAAGDLLVFVDDDNVLNPDYFSVILSNTADSTIGAIGGAGIPVFDENCEPPPFFYNFATKLACGAQLGTPANVTESVVDLTSIPRACLFGAGLAIRRSDSLDIISLPDFPTLTGRKGATLSSGEDYEICHLIALRGKRLIYCDQLRFKHLIPADRVHPNYLRRLASPGEHKNINGLYVAARKFRSEGLPLAELTKIFLKILAFRCSYRDRFVLALKFDREWIAAPADRPIFRNVSSLKNPS